MVQPDPAAGTGLPQLESLPGKFAESLLHIHPGEGRHVALLFIQLFASSGIFILGRTVRDTLFLSRYPVALLPWMFVLYGIGAALVSLFYGRYADRVPRSVLLYVTCGVGILTYLAVWILVRAGIPLVYPFFYVWSEIVSNLLILQFWTLASELDHPRDARRLNATIGAARPLGVVFFGFGTGWVVHLIGTAQLLFVLIVLMAVITASTYLLRHQPRVSSSPSAHEAKGRGDSPGRPLEKTYFRSISLLMLIMFLALTLGDYQFKIIARASYTEDSLAQFFSLFYGVVGILSIGFQLFLTPAILSKLGVGAALTVMPGVFGTSSVLMLLWPGLAAACSLKFADNGLQFTLHDTTMQSLYSPFPSAARGRTRAFLDGAIKPLSYGAGGLMLVVLLYAHFDVRQISFITIPLALGWQVLVPLVRRGYLQLLEKGLAGPMAAQLFTEPFVIGSAERRILIQTLESKDSAAVMVALEQLQNDRSVHFRQSLQRLLHHSESAIRARAIRILDVMEDSSALNDFAQAARDSDPLVRAAAAAALARFIGDDNPDQLLPFLDDSSREVRVQALACLIRYGGLEGATRAGDRLLEMISSEEPEQRREACLVLSRLGHTAYLSLKRLLQDPEARVRRAAMRAASGTADPQLVPPIIRGLYDPAVWKTAMSALVAIGEAAVPHIEQAMRDPQLPRAVRLQLPRILSRIPSTRSFIVLRDYQGDTDSHFRLRVFAAMGRLRARLGYAPIPPRLLAARVRREALEVWGNLLAWNAARERFGTTLLIEEMDFRKRRAERRILRLLEMSYGLREIGLILAALQDPARRDEALDALEALLDASLRDLVIPVLESLGPGHTPPPASDPNLSVLPAVQFMLLQAYHPNPYVNFLALDALARAGEQSAIPAAQNALVHADPLVREAGLHALARLDLEHLRPTAAALRADADPTVARWAHYYSELGAGPNANAATMGDHMHDTVEKILFLKGTPIFSRLPGEDLAPLARVAEVIHFEEGDSIIKEGEHGDCFYVVINGLVVLESEGTELRSVGSPGMIGELAVLDRGVQSASARALKPSDLLRIGAEEFFEILHEQTEIAESLIRILAAEVREAQKRLVQQTRDQKNN
jgi:HEAT repeat protein/ATP/ADP translocase